ncbi:MAG: GntR family transcriptional regulator [Pseudomonadota bacterium]
MHPRPSAQTVYAELKERILSFALYPGTRVTETELSLDFGVSRTPIREALQRLAVEGFVTIRPKQGCFVRELDIDEIDQFYQVRTALEGLSLEQALIHMPRTALEELAQRWHPSRSSEAPPSVEAMAQHDESFHMALAEGSGNRVLAGLLKDVNARIHIIRRLDFTARERIAITYAEHHRMLELLLDGDLTAARALMQAHIRYSQEFARSLTLRRLAELRHPPLQAGTGNG